MNVHSESETPSEPAKNPPGDHPMTFHRSALLLCLNTVGCLSISANGEPDDDDGGDESSESDASASSDDGVVAEVAFYEDIAPLLANHCNGCHSEGGVAPFTLTSYADAVEWAAPILAAVESRTMPPFTVNNDGSCQTFTDARWLEEEDIDRPSLGRRGDARR